MPFTAEQQEQITRALSAKVTQPCPGCGQRRRLFFPDLTIFTTTAVAPQSLLEALTAAAHNMQGGQATGTGTGTGIHDLFRPRVPPTGPASIGNSAAIPCIVVTCMNCGFTEFYNVHVLGLASVLKIPPPGEPLDR